MSARNVVSSHVLGSERSIILGCCDGKKAGDALLNSKDYQ